MKIKISNFAKIVETEMVIDGITVIAGHNNSGKSTIGRIIFSLFNSLNNMEKKIDTQRKREISKISNNVIRNYLESSQNESIINHTMIRRIGSRIAEILSKRLEESNDEMLKHQEIYAIVFDLLKRNTILNEGESIGNVVEDISNNVESIMNLPNNLVMCEVITRYFQQAFSGQINCLHNQNKDAVLELTIKDKKLTTKFKNNKCTNFDSSYTILHEAFYIDNPFIIDELNEYSYLRYLEDTGSPKEHIISKLTGNNDGIMSGIFEAVIAKEKLKEINSNLDRVIDGNVIYDNNELRLDASSYYEPLKLNNLSTGMKSFLIIKILLEKGILKEKDVIILDEPEIHLHPEWQLIYAEIIVLLLKVFDLSIIVTTHSSHFLDAIDYFSKKHAMEDKCKYYLSSVNNGLSSFKDVTGNLNEIYKQMVQPSVLIDKLRNEMDNTDED